MAEASSAGVGGQESGRGGEREREKERERECTPAQYLCRVVEHEADEEEEDEAAPPAQAEGVRLGQEAQPHVPSDGRMKG